jgi:hypothetical protein
VSTGGAGGRRSEAGVGVRWRAHIPAEPTSSADETTEGGTSAGETTEGATAVGPAAAVTGVVMAGVAAGVAADVAAADAARARAAAGAGDVRLDRSYGESVGGSTISLGLCARVDRRGDAPCT